MAAAEEKDDIYRLMYWTLDGEFTGRAQPIILLLEDGGIPWELVNCELFKYENANTESPYSTHAFPQLEKGSFVLAQTTAIMKYLGEVHGYDGETPEEKAHVCQVALNAADIWSEAYQARMGSQQVGLTTDFGKTFWQGKRAEKWLQRLEKQVKATDGDFFFGSKVTYADFCVFNVIHALRWLYGTHFEEEYNNCPALKDFEKAIGDRPNVKARLAKNVPVLYEGCSHRTLPAWD